MAHKFNHSKQRTALNSRDLLDAGLVSESQTSEIDKVSEEFAMAVTPEMMEIIDPQDSVDPIARQFIPNIQETTVLTDELADPIGDDPFTPVKGITHRYPDRLLLKPVHVCPIYCRFCFRREKVGPGSEALSSYELETALDYIRTHTDVWEVILTGGDPLILSERRLAKIIDALDAMEHIEVIRIHTRVPVVDSTRITAEIVRTLKVSTPVYVVLHCNHARELTPAALKACATLVDGGVPMLSQTVLLQGVNNDPEVMSQLLRALVRARVKPYYLHHADLAKGTSHFRLSIEEGQSLMRALRGDVSGICQPTYVLDIPGGHGKVPIGPNYLHMDTSTGDHTVVDYQGSEHAYPQREQ